MAEAQIPLDFTAAATRRDTGMDRVARRANKARPGWTSEAVVWIRRCAEQHQEFLTEYVRAWAEKNGFPRPDNAKAWGPAMKRAEAENVIQADGYAPAMSSNLSPKVKWKSLVFKGARE